MNAGVIIALAIGGILVISILCILFSLCKSKYWPKGTIVPGNASISGSFVRELTIPATDVYKFSKHPLGEGATGKCFIATLTNESDRRFAVKVIDTSDENEKKFYERECQILKAVGEHLNIVRLYEVYRNPGKLYFIMELCTGGHLQDVLDRLPGGKFDEKIARQYTTQLISAIAHCHNMGICHRDVKLQNILLDSNAAEGQLKLIDFGNAKQYINHLPMTQVVGTPYAMAPEMLKGKYDERVDIWSIGVVCYILMSGKRPFETLNIPNEPKVQSTSLVSSIMMGRYDFRSEEWDEISNETIHFIQLCLTMDYTHRPRAADLKKLPWCNIHKLDDKLLTDKSVKNFNNYLQRNQSTAFGRASMLAVAFTMPASKARDLREIFQQIDVDGSGWVDRKEFHKAIKEVNPRMEAADVDKLFDTIDQDGNQQISFLEFVASMIDPRDIDVNEINQAFKLLDVKNTGYITHDDLYRVLSAGQQSVVNEETSSENVRRSSFGDGLSLKAVEDSQAAPTVGLIPPSTSTKGFLRKSFNGTLDIFANAYEANDKADTVAIDIQEIKTAQNSESDIKLEKTRRLHEKIQRIIEQADVDHDGKISYAEFVLTMSCGTIDTKKLPKLPPATVMKPSSESSKNMSQRFSALFNWSNSGEFNTTPTAKQTSKRKLNHKNSSRILQKGSSSKSFKKSSSSKSFK